MSTVIIRYVEAQICLNVTYKQEPGELEQEALVSACLYKFVKSTCPCVHWHAVRSMCLCLMIHASALAVSCDS